MEKAHFRIVTADNGSFCRLIKENVNYRRLPNIIAKKLNMPLSSLVLFYNGKSLSYYKKNKFKQLPLPDEHEGLIDICIATLFSHHRQVIRMHKHLLLPPLMYPIIVTSSFGVRIMEEFSLHQNTLVVHILQKLYKAYLIPIELQELYHMGRKLENDECLADLFFTQDKFSSRVALLLNFTNLRHEQVKIFNQRYYKSLKHIALESLTVKELIDIEKENIWSVYKLKDLIHRTRRIPVKQQRLLHQGTILKDQEMIYDRFMLENKTNDTGIMTITMVVEPCYINVKFTSDYLEMVEILPCMQFTTMTTFNEMSDKIAEITGLSQDSITLIPLLALLDNVHINNPGAIFYEEDMLGEVTSLQDLRIKVVKNITIDLGEESMTTFKYLIQDKDETIKHLREQLEIGYKERQLKLVLLNSLKSKIRLLDLPNDEVLKFEAKRIESCNLF